MLFPKFMSTYLGAALQDIIIVSFALTSVSFDSMFRLKYARIVKYTVFQKRHPLASLIISSE